MREKNRKPIASYIKLPQFTTMNVIDGQAGLIIYASLIFYSLTIDNILNIIVLLILAGVTVATLTGDNGLLTKSKLAVDKNSEGETKEGIILAATNSRMKSLGLIDIDTLDNELMSVFGKDKYELLIVGEGFLISVNNIEYLVEKDGKVSDGNIVEVSNIENAGDLSKGGQYDGTTEETAYRITCIEDLVEWSNNYNNYASKNIKLEKTVDFNSTASYKNARAKTTDINSNGKTEELITELTTGAGFKPIESFSGVFDGQDNEIKNIFEYRTQNAGLFSTINNASISNLTITGTITAINSYAGGITGFQSSSQLTNITNKSKILGIEAGGIIGRSQHGVNIKRSCNYNKIEGTDIAGGIIGYLYGAHSTTTIEECFNKANINSSNISAGGIVGSNTGWSGGEVVNIKYCYNIGNISSKEYAGGIEGFLSTGPTGDISNCYSIAKGISANNSASIAIKGNGNLVNFNECFYYNEKNLISYGGIEKKTRDYMKTDDFLDKLNTQEDIVFIKDVNNINEGFPILSWQNK